MRCQMPNRGTISLHRFVFIYDTLNTESSSLSVVLVTSRLAKRAKVMVSQASVCSTVGRGGVRGCLVAGGGGGRGCLVRGSGGG